MLNPSGATIAVANATITIVDDDYAMVSVEDVTVTENAGVASVPFVLSQVSMKPVTVYYTTASTGSAANGVDFIAKSGNFTFERGKTRMTVDVSIINDSLVESPRTFVMMYTALEGGRPGRPIATVTILDDDSAPSPATPPHRRSARH